MSCTDKKQIIDTEPFNEKEKQQKEKEKEKKEQGKKGNFFDPFTIYTYTYTYTSITK